MERPQRQKRSQCRPILQLLLLLFVFMSSVNMMGAGFKLMGKGFSETLLAVTGNPFAGLMIGIMATAVVQSSSATTTLIIGLVAQGSLEIANAVPMIMGANIGTTVTCTLVALGYIGQPKRFRLAFSAGTMHDIFNILTVCVMLPLELATGVLTRTAGWLAGRLDAFTHFSSPKSPLKIATSLLARLVRYLLNEAAGLGSRLTAGIMLAVALVLLFVSLYFLTRVMKGFLANRMEAILDRYIFRTPFTALLVGLSFTMAVQSSSVTTSLIVPLVAAGVLRPLQAFPYTMGANVGTTITGFLAALGMGRPEGLAIALVHALFNLTGVAVFFPFRRIRSIPVRLARMLAAMTLRSRWYAVVYILIVFFVLPGICLLLWR